MTVHPSSRPINIHAHSLASTTSSLAGAGAVGSSRNQSATSSKVGPNRR
jgi:hypothetical protein